MSVKRQTRFPFFVKERLYSSSSHKISFRYKILYIYIKCRPKFDGYL